MPQRKTSEAPGFLITDTARLLRAEFDRMISEESLGITPGEARALAHAARAGAVRQAALAERMGVEAMTLSTYLDRLEEQGLVTREPDPADRRAKIVRLTAAAGKILPRIEKVGERVRLEATEGIGEADWAGFLATLMHLRENLLARRLETGRTRSAA
jgi:MarR family transcriptional regulator, transcriptional regulator for hemolysin